MRPSISKAIGQGLLVCALVGQWFVLDSTKDTETSIRSAVENSMSADLRGNQLMQLYLTTTNSALLKGAARERTRTALMLMAIVSADANDFDRVAHKLKALAESVSDERSYNALHDVLQSLTTKAHEAFPVRLARLSRTRKIAWWTVFALLATSGSFIAYGEFKSKS